MDARLALIGFGEAARCFAEAAQWRGQACAYDIKTDELATRAAKQADYAAAAIVGAASLREALTGCAYVLSLTTADQARAVAQAAARCDVRGAFYYDFNSAAPQTKADAASFIETAGAHYIDVAVMAPVYPRKLETPLLISGARARDGAEILTRLGFTHVRIIGCEVGRASTVKMLRSIMIKGIEALSASCALAADRAGVLDEVLESLGGDWRAQFDYNLDRAMAHGLRRAAEMDEAAAMLRFFGEDDALATATAALHRRIGGRSLTPPPATLAAKLGALRSEP